MRALATLIALTMAAGCVDNMVGGVEDPMAPAHMLAPDQELLVFFQSGVDEPPASAPVVNCAAASGLCLGGMTPPAPIRTTEAGYALEWGTTAVTLYGDGTGAWAPASGARIGITWMTQPR
jgi:hypothetical protein